MTERYVYSGLETVCVYDGTNGWRQDYVFGQGIDEVLMLEQDDVLDFDGDQNTSENTRSFYHRNALGSVMEITDLNQAEVASYRYTAAGWGSPPYVCGDYAADITTKCCLDGQGAPMSSSRRGTSTDGGATAWPTMAEENRENDKATDRAAAGG